MHLFETGLMKKTNLIVRLFPHEHRILKIAAAERNMTMSKYVRRCLSEQLIKEGKIDVVFKSNWDKKDAN